jgi:hypothetical protein
MGCLPHVLFCGLSPNTAGFEAAAANSAIAQGVQVTGAEKLGSSALNVECKYFFSRSSRGHEAHISLETKAKVRASSRLLLF